MVHKKKILVPVFAECYISKSNNNIFLTLVKINGEVICQLSGGNIGMKGPKRSTSNAAELVGKKLGLVAVNLGYKRCNLIVKGSFDNLLRSALRGLLTSKIRIMELKQVECVSHNGVRLKKLRRM